MLRPPAWRPLALAALTLAAPLAARAEGPASPVSHAAPLAPVIAGAPAPHVVPAAPVYDLPRILVLADKNHPNIAQSRAKVLQARAQLDEAHFAPFSQFKFSGGIAIAPTIKGNNVFSP